MCLGVHRALSFYYLFWLFYWKIQAGNLICRGVGSKVFMLGITLK